MAMKKKDLKKMSKRELLEIMLLQSKRIDELENEIDKMNSMLDDKKILLSNCGSIAEAALKLNNIFEAAQNAADQYLKNIELLSKEEIALRKSREEAEALKNKIDLVKETALMAIPVEVKKENIFKRMFRKVRNVFKFKKNRRRKVRKIVIKEKRVSKPSKVAKFKGVLNRLKDIIKMAGLSIKKGFKKFGVGIKVGLIWLRDGMKTVFKKLINGSKTIFIKIKTNIKNSIENLKIKLREKKVISSQNKEKKKVEKAEKAKNKEKTNIDKKEIKAKGKEKSLKSDKTKNNESQKAAKKSENADKSVKKVKSQESDKSKKKDVVKENTKSKKDSEKVKKSEKNDGKVDKIKKDNKVLKDDKVKKAKKVEKSVKSKAS